MRRLKGHTREQTSRSGDRDRAPARRRPVARRRLVATVAVCGAVLLCGAMVAAPHKPDRGHADRPPMGWNSWNHFRCDVSDSLVRTEADAMVATGMRDVGYHYIVIDDCWQTARDADGAIVADSARFPRGIKALADYVHGRGLGFGIYTDAGTATCKGRPGTLGHAATITAPLARIGIDRDTIAVARDLWTHTDLGVFARKVSTQVPAHGVTMLRVGAG